MSDSVDVQSRHREWDDDQMPHTKMADQDLARLHPCCHAKSHLQVALQWTTSEVPGDTPASVSLLSLALFIIFRSAYTVGPPIDSHHQHLGLITFVIRY
jgi:hypothetical protein